MKIIKLILILFIPITFLMFSKCYEEKVETISIRPMEERHFKAPREQKSIRTSQFLQTDSGNYLACFYYKNPDIIYYDFETGDSVKSVPVKKMYKSLLSFYVHRPDSIFLFYNAAYNPNYDHDSTLLLINNAGKILNSYSLAGSPVVYKSNERPFGVLGYASYFFDQLIYDKNKIFLKFGYGSNGFDSAYMTSFLPAGGHIHTDENQFYNHKVRFPDFGGNAFNYPNSYQTFSSLTLSHRGNPVYAYMHTSEIFEYDLAKSDVSSHSMHSLLIDTIVPVKKPDDNFSNKEGEYVQLHFNEYDNRYYRFFVLPVPDNSPPAIRNIMRTGVVVSDTLFRKLGEGIIPQGYSTNQPVFSPKGIWLRKNDLPLDSIIYTLFEFEYTKESKVDFLTKMNELSTSDIPVNDENIGSYVIDVLNTDTNETGLILVPSSSCPACIINTFNYYKENYEYLNKNKIHLVIPNDKNVINYFGEDRVKDSKYNIHIDSSKTYLKYMYKFINPRLSYFKDGKLVFDSIYSPSSLVYIHLHIDSLRNIH